MRYRSFDEVDSVQFIVKITNRCNLRCEYCYERERKAPASESLTIPKLKILFQKTSRFIAANCHKPVSVRFVWHGGEPLLVSAETFRRVFDLCDRLVGKAGISVSHAIQTNGMVPPERWLDLLLRPNVSLGVSYDYGSPHRRTTTGTPSGDVVLDHIQRLQDLGVDPEILCVISDANVRKAKSMYDFFSRRHLDFNLLPLRPAAIARRLGPRPQAFGKLLVRLAHSWIEDDSPKPIRIRNIECAAGNILRQRNAEISCAQCRNCVQMFFLIDPNGDVRHCDFVNASFGNIFRSSFRKIVDHQQRIELLMRRPRDVLPHCKSCRWLRYCWGGCGCDGFDQKDYYCEAICMLNAFICEHLAQVRKRMRVANHRNQR